MKYIKTYEKKSQRLLRNDKTIDVDSVSAFIDAKKYNL